MEHVNPWKNIPLEDYEQHMQHEEVAQAQLLSALMNKYLQKHTPENILFLGISGGNGLEHIDIKRVKKVCGIDINSTYLEETKKRFDEKIKQLELFNLDIGTSNRSLIKSDFVWAALILEYVDIEKAFDFIDCNIGKSSNLIITIQSNNGATSVSQTGIESVKSVKDIFKVIDAEHLESSATHYGFKLTSREENNLPNGKSFITFGFLRKCNTPIEQKL